MTINNMWRVCFTDGIFIAHAKYINAIMDIRTTLKMIIRKT